MLTLIFLLANSTATLFVNPSKACLVDAYPESPLNPFTPTIEPIFTIEKLFFFCFKNSKTIFWVKKKWLKKLF